MADYHNILLENTVNHLKYIINDNFFFKFLVKNKNKIPSDHHFAVYVPFSIDKIKNKNATNLAQTNNPISNLIAVSDTLDSHTLIIRENTEDYRYYGKIDEHLIDVIPYNSTNIEEHKNIDNYIQTSINTLDFDYKDYYANVKNEATKQSMKKDLKEFGLNEISEFNGFEAVYFIFKKVDNEFKFFDVQRLSKRRYPLYVMYKQLEYLLKLIQSSNITKTEILDYYKPTIHSVNNSMSNEEIRQIEQGIIYLFIYVYYEEVKDDADYNDNFLNHIKEKLNSIQKFLYIDEKTRKTIDISGNTDSAVSNTAKPNISVILRSAINLVDVKKINKSRNINLQQIKIDDKSLKIRGIISEIISRRYLLRKEKKNTYVRNIQTKVKTINFASRPGTATQSPGTAKKQRPGTATRRPGTATRRTDT